VKVETTKLVGGIETLKEKLSDHATALANGNSAFIVIVLSCTRDSYFRTIRIHGKAHSNTHIGTSRTWLRPCRRKLLACVQFLHSTEHSGSRICSGLVLR
jgi:hypothetical protein